jgi:hypothetical protein
VGIECIAAYAFFFNRIRVVFVFTAGSALSGVIALYAVGIDKFAGLAPTSGGLVVALSTGNASLKGWVACGTILHPVVARLAKTAFRFPVLSAGDAKRTICTFYTLRIYGTALLAVMLFKVIYFRYAGEALVYGRAGEASVHLITS